MKATQLLDAAKERLELKSDYELAKKMGIGNGPIAEMRKGNRGIPLHLAYWLADTLDLDPAQVIAQLEEEREKNPERAAYWKTFLSRAEMRTALPKESRLNMVGRVGVEPTTNGLRG